MRKGFTLIELLAVIVILAIIATIATPIVLSIIEDTKKSAGLRSADYYLSALETTIATSTLNNYDINDGTYKLKEGDVCLDSSCIQKLEVEIKGETPSEGVITIKEGQISYIFLNLGNKEIIQNEKDELVYYESPCKRITGNKNTPGSKYECEVKPGVKYNFYVLSQEKNGTTNLIMDRNINSDGTPVTEAITYEQYENEEKEVYNLLPWINENDYGTLYSYDENICWNQDGCILNDKGPITAMKFLYNATKDWTNIPVLNYEYYNKEYQGTAAENISYTSFVSNDGISTITVLDRNKTTIGTSDKPLRTRMPIFSRTYDEDWNIIAEKGEVSDIKDDDSNAYLYENLHENGTDDIYGYWTLSSITSDNYSAWDVYYDGNGIVSYDDVNYEYGIGVRPVINLQL